MAKMLEISWKNGLTGEAKKATESAYHSKFLEVAPNNMLFALKIREAMNALFQTLILLEVK